MREPASARRTPWPRRIIYLSCGMLAACGAVGVAINGVLGGFIGVFAFGVPLAAVGALAIVLTHAGIRPRHFCGYCGYDRTGFDPRAPCPECGRDSTAPTAPGYRAVGRRALPVWIWLPALALLLGTLFLPSLLSDRPGASMESTFFLGLLGLIALLAGAFWHAWKQAG